MENSLSEGDKVIICQLVQKQPGTNNYFYPGEILTYEELLNNYSSVLKFPNSFRLYTPYLEKESEEKVELTDVIKVDNPKLKRLLKDSKEEDSKSIKENQLEK